MVDRKVEYEHRSYNETTCKIQFITPTKKKKRKLKPKKEIHDRLYEEALRRQKAD